MQFTNITTYLKQPPYFFICDDFLNAINKYSGFRHMITGFLSIELDKKIKKNKITVLLDETTHAAIEYKIIDGNYYFKLYDILEHN